MGFTPKCDIAQTGLEIISGPVASDWLNRTQTAWD
jgi:hypothetical protein